LHIELPIEFASRGSYFAIGSNILLLQRLFYAHHIPTTTTPLPVGRLLGVAVRVAVWVAVWVAVVAGSVDVWVARVAGGAGVAGAW